MLLCTVISCLLMLPFTVSGAGPDNRGKEFILGFLENNVVNLDLEIFVTTMRTTTVSVNVSTPLFSNYFETFTVTAGEVKQLFMAPSIRMSGTAKESKGVLIEADDEVVVYGVNKEQYSTDAYLGLPTDVLGTEYYAVTHYPPSRQCEMMIVGVNDSTTISVRLPNTMGAGMVTWNGNSYGGGDTITETLNRYEAFQITSTEDLSGSYITSDKIVGVISGNMKTRIGSGSSSDHLTEMLNPVDSWGKNFITVPIPDRTVGDLFRIITSESNTHINISGGYTASFTIANAGNVTELSIGSTAYCSVVASKAIMLVQFVLSQQSSSEKSDPAMMVIPPVEQFAADYTFTTPKYSLGSYINYFMFVVKDADKDGLKIDGVPFSTTYNSLAGTDYVGGYIEVSEGTHTVRHDLPIKIFGGYLYGRANYETYAFTTGMRLAPINTVCVPSTTSLGDGLDNDCDGYIDEEMCTGSNAGVDDDGDGVTDEDCATPSPIDGNWTDWNSWSSCSITCESTTGGATSGTQIRERFCINPPPQYDGKQCVGDGHETTSCAVNVFCPVDGVWSDWSGWGTCSVTCGGGQQSKVRTCTNPAPQYGGSDCSGDSGVFQDCNTVACPTASINHYVQVCPSGWFSCYSGAMTCIDNNMRCDCVNDCDDGSDETESYAGCSASFLQACRVANANAAIQGRVPLSLFQLFIVMLTCLAVMRRH